MDCGFYEEIKPTAQKGSEVQTVESPGGVWKAWLLPGTDNSWTQVHDVPPCFEPQKKIEFLRELDRLGCRDSGLMAIKMLAKIRENSMWLSTEMRIFLEALAGSSLEGSADYEKILAKIRKLDVGKIATLIELVRVSYLFPEDYLKFIDSAFVELYTKGIEGLKIDDDVLWVFGKKELRDVVLADAKVWTQAKQVILFSDEAGIAAGIAVVVSKDFLSKALGEDVLRLGTKKSLEEGLEIGSESAFSYGYNQGGYNIGVYR